MDASELPDGWAIWHAPPEDIVVLVYRPDVFDSSTYPARCLPTLAIKPERARGPRGRPQSARHGRTWCAELTLEPDVQVARRTAPDRETAIDTGLDLAYAFIDGDFEINEVYVDPHEAYLERLEELIE